MTSPKRASLVEMPMFPQASPGGTGEVYVSPSGIDREIAGNAVKQLDMSAVFRDFGAVAARELANALERYALRAADYKDEPDIPAQVAKMLAAELPKSEAFVRAFRTHLETRG